MTHHCCGGGTQGGLRGRVGMGVGGGGGWKAGLLRSGFCGSVGFGVGGVGSWGSKSIR